MEQLTTDVTSSGRSRATLPQDRGVSESLEAVLAAHPDAWVGAMGPDALLYTDVPSGAPFAGHRVLQGRWVLDHVVAAERPALGDAWRRSHVEGAAAVSAQIVGGGTATFYIFDAIDAHGSYIVIAVEHDGAQLITANLESHEVQPRHCRVLREESGRICDVDDAAELVLGWSPDQLIAALPLTLIHPDDHGRVIETWMATLSDPSCGHRCRARFLRPDGTWMWLELTNHQQLHDQLRRVDCEMLDISEEMAAHEAVRAREQLLHRLAEALPIGVLQIDRERSITYKNDHLSLLLGNESATSSDEQFAAVHVDDKAIVLGAIGEGLDDGEDRDVAVRVIGGSDERVVRVITKALIDDSREVSGVIVSVTDVTDETNTSRDLERRATFDALTGCLNRASILDRLEASLHDHARSVGTAVIFIDLDGFKAINDRSGHSVGDDVLQLVADHLRSATRGHDDVGRLGGDEFLIVCSDVSARDAMNVARRIVDHIGREPAIDGLDAPVRASVGVAWGASATVDAATLVARADEAMYRSKEIGEGEPQLWTD